MNKIIRYEFLKLTNIQYQKYIRLFTGYEQVQSKLDIRQEKRRALQRLFSSVQLGVQMYQLKAVLWFRMGFNLIGSVADP